MTDWLYEGDETTGTIVGGGGERYPCRLEQGQVQVYLPFEVDQSRLGELLRRDGWAVGRREDRVDSQGWGPRLEVDGYYPYWLRSAPGEGGAVLAFPPLDYRVGEGRVTHTEGAARWADGAAGAVRAPGEGTEGRRPDGPGAKGSRPVIGSETLEVFGRLFPYVKGAARRSEG